jgi:hypothetical protein
LSDGGARGEMMELSDGREGRGSL